ncbi:hypothetical protein KJ627_03785 [Patescibacteria group bacterium]|nr:hypothetical protein [Patescibacteria group bacterium]
MPKKIIKKEINPKDPECGLCGKKKNPRYKTECCGNWICDDEENYVMFSYSRKHCSRNHRRFTLCGHHHAESHSGDWKTCKECYKDFEHELEMYVWYGTNEYNFEVLPNPPEFKPTYCSKCGKRLILPDGGFSTLCEVYRCDECGISPAEREEIINDYKRRNKTEN